MCTNAWQSENNSPEYFYQAVYMVWIWEELPYVWDSGVLVKPLQLGTLNDLTNQLIGLMDNKGLDQTGGKTQRWVIF